MENSETKSSISKPTENPKCQLGYRVLAVYRELNERSCLLWHVPKYWFTLGSGKKMYECLFCGLALNTDQRLKRIEEVRQERGMAQ